MSLRKKVEEKASDFGSKGLSLHFKLEYHRGRGRSGGRSRRRPFIWVHILKLGKSYTNSSWKLN